MERTTAVCAYLIPFLSTRLLMLLWFGSPLNFGCADVSWGEKPTGNESH